MPSKMKGDKVDSETKADGKRISTKKPQTRKEAQKPKTVPKNSQETSKRSRETARKTKNSSENSEIVNNVTTTKPSRSLSRSCKNKINSDLTETSETATQKSEKNNLGSDSKTVKSEKQTIGTKFKRKSDSKIESGSDVSEIESTKGKLSKQQGKNGGKKPKLDDRTLETEKLADSTHIADITTENSVESEQIDNDKADLKSKKNVSRQRKKVDKIGKTENSVESEQIDNDKANLKSNGKVGRQKTKVDKTEPNITSSTKIVKNTRRTATKKKSKDGPVSSARTINDVKEETKDDVKSENIEMIQEPNHQSLHAPVVTMATDNSEVSFMSDSESDESDDDGDFEEVQENEEIVESGKRKCLSNDEDVLSESPTKKFKMETEINELAPSNTNKNRKSSKGKNSTNDETKVKLSNASTISRKSSKGQNSTNEETKVTHFNASTKSRNNSKGKNSTNEEIVETNSSSSKKPVKTPVSKKSKAKISDTTSENMQPSKPNAKVKSETKTKKPGKPTENKPEVKPETSSHVSLPEIDENDVTSVLLRMEGQSHLSTMTTRADNSSLDSDSDEEDSDWEEVEDHSSPVKSQIPDKPVEITLDLPDILKKKKRKKFDWKAWVQRKIRRFQKDVRIGMHKVEVLCLLSHGIQQNTICNKETLLAQALSLVPATIGRQNLNLLDTQGLKRLVRSLRSVISQEDLSRERQSGLIDSNSLEKIFESQELTTEKELVLVFIIFLRALGFDVRLVMSFHPLPLKEVDPAKKKNKPPKSRKMKKFSEDENKKLVEKQKNLNQPIKSDNKNKKTGKNAANSDSDKSTKTTSSKKSDSVKSTKTKNSQKLIAKNSLRRKSASKIKSYACDLDSDSGSEDFVPEDSGNESSYSEENIKVDRRGMSGKRNKLKNDEQEDGSSSDFQEEEIVYRSPEEQRSKKSLTKNSKVLSSDSSDSGDNATGTDVWLEVYLQEEQKWICVDCIQLEVNKPYEIEAAATSPLHYCLAYSNDGSIKDVTARYASQWLSHTRKLRVDSDWWRETLIVYRSGEESNEQDDEHIKDQLVNRPLPTSIAQFKNHPLYVLQRHLLKFEAIYPASAVPVGYVRKEPVFARECVHVLHSRENWMKEGKAVKLGELPYKMVKSRPKWNKPKEDPDKLDLELFGEWQTDIYIPPPAVDGKVPRNEYGNVELFKPWMLPGGTVHIKVPALNRIAKKLGVDCVAAMVGWDYHGGFSHAMLDGWVVCEEHAESLMAAWEEDLLIQQQKEVEKKQNRVIGNWQLLTKSLLLKEKLKKKYDV